VQMEPLWTFPPFWRFKSKLFPTAGDKSEDMIVQMEALLYRRTPPPPTLLKGLIHNDNHCR